MKSSITSLRASNSSPFRNSKLPFSPNKLPHISNIFSYQQMNQTGKMKTLLNSTNASNLINYHNRNLEVIKKITGKCDEIKQASPQPEKRGSMARFNKVKKFFKIISNDEKQELMLKKQKSIVLKKKQTYYYSVLSGNNAECIKRCMQQRRNWKENQTAGSINASHFIWAPISIQIPFLNLYEENNIKQMANHFECHSQISNKQNLLINMANHCEKKKLDLWKYIPLTILIHNDNIHYDKQFESFQVLMNNIEAYVGKDNAQSKKYKEMFYFDTQEKIGHKTPLYIPNKHYNGRNLWLVKATNLNRGRCIKVVDSIESIEAKIKSFQLGTKKQFEEHENDTSFPIISSGSSEVNKNSTYQPGKYKANVVILQKYIEKPLLYYGRKFDMRVWALVTHNLEVYAFKEGHLKASSFPYDLYSKNAYIHLTNYSVQKNSSHFSMFEDGNEISFQQFQTSLHVEHKKNINVHDDIFPALCNIIKLTMKSVKNKLNPFHRTYCFEIFGYDFIFDEDINPYLLEVNTNPGLEESSPLIKTIVPRMIDDALRLTIDNFYPTEYYLKEGYESPFEVEGYNNKENMWKFVCSLSEEK